MNLEEIEEELNSLKNGKHMTKILYSIFFIVLIAILLYKLYIFMLCQCCYKTGVCKVLGFYDYYILPLKTLELSGFCFNVVFYSFAAYCEISAINYNKRRIVELENMKAELEKKDNTNLN